MTGLAPIAVSEEDIRQWPDGRPRLFDLGCQIVRYMPRGKGWLPRQMGRWLGGRLRGVLRTAHDARLAIDTRNLDVYTAYALEPVLSEADVIDACRAVLNPDDVLYDVGANAGVVFLELTALLRGRLRTIAFEPQPSVARAAAVSAALNGFGDVTVYRALVGPESGCGTLFISTGSAQASVKAVGPGDERVDAPMVSLDDFLAASGAPPPTLIKVDVEGAELDVFRGAAGLIRAHRPYLVFETFPQHMARFGYGREDLLRYLRSVGGYRFYATDAVRPGVLTPEPADGPFRASPNVLAVPPGRPDPRPVAQA
jgi:FkbM family methyltransferase